MDQAVAAISSIREAQEGLIKVIWVLAPLNIVGEVALIARTMETRGAIINLMMATNRIKDRLQRADWVETNQGAATSSPKFLSSNPKVSSLKI